MAKVRALEINGLGNKLLSFILKRFTVKVQRKLVRRATKTSAKRLKRYVVAGLSEHIDTGELIVEMLTLQTGPLKRRTAVQGHGLPRPRTKKLAIRLNALEYGFKNKLTGRFVPPKAPVRKAINEKKAIEHSLIESQLKREIKKEWKQMTRKLRKLFK